MKVMSEETKFAHLGKPGTAFSAGFRRRLEMIKKYVDLKDKKILDMGTGEGVWLAEFAKESGSYGLIFATEYDAQTLEVAKANNHNLIPQNLRNCPGEKLDFPDNSFDIVFHNEVLEHVQDDQKVLEECFRVLKLGGIMIFFTPNRLWPFEQHGIFLNGKYYWGNIPLLPWMPNFIYKKFAPHVRSYWGIQLRKMILKAYPKAQFILFTQIFPGFDGAVRRLGILGKLIQIKFLFLEKTPFHVFGISHFVIVKKG